VRHGQNQLMRPRRTADIKRACRASCSFRHARWEPGKVFRAVSSATSRLILRVSTVTTAEKASAEFGSFLA
jgi:hypothetical protein